MANVVHSWPTDGSPAVFPLATMRALYARLQFIPLLSGDRYQHLPLWDANRLECLRYRLCQE